MPPSSPTTPVRLWTPSAITFFVNGALYGAWATQAPIAKARLGVTEAHFGLLLLAMGLGAVMAMGVSGRLTARFGAAPIIVGSFPVFVLSLLGISLAGTPGFFAPALLLFGASGGMMDVAMNALAAEAEARIGHPVMSSIHGMWSIGGLAGSALGSYLLSLVSAPVQATILGGGLACLFLTIQPRLSLGATRSDKERSASRRVSGFVWIIACLAGLCFASEGSVRDWSGLYLLSERATPLGMAGWGYSAYSATMALGRFTGDGIRARVGNTWAIFACGVVAAAGFGLTATATSYLIIIIGFAMVGLGLSNIVPIFISVAGRLPNPSSSISIVVTMGYAAYLVSPPILGAIAGGTSLATMFLIVGAAVLAIAAIWTSIAGRGPK
jgi:hypothetical protein